MPLMNGIELQSTLLAKGVRIPMIFITAFPEDGARMQAMAAGAVDFLTKPFDGKTIIKALGTAAGFAPVSKLEEAGMIEGSSNVPVCATCNIVALAGRTSKQSPYIQAGDELHAAARTALSPVPEQTMKISDQPKLRGDAEKPIFARAFCLSGKARARGSERTAACALERAVPAP
eukprot:gene63085-86295_t